MRSTIECIGFIISSSAETFTVVLPEKPFGKLKAKFPQKEKYVDAEYYDKYELKAFNIIVDEANNIIDWSFKNVLKCVEVRYFVALLADRRIIADDGKAYKIWDHTAVQSETWVSQFDWAFSRGDFDTVQNVKLLIRNGIIYATEKERAYKFRESWRIEDTLAKYLGSYDRYSIRNNSTEREKLFTKAEKLDAFDK